MFEQKETHPSFGMLQFNRTQGGETHLFGSSIQHRDTIRMCLRTGEVQRGLSSDWYMGNDALVEVEMSYSQFAEVITSMNMGSGVPVTIRYIRGQGNIEPCPFTNKKKQFEEEFKENLSKSNEKANDLLCSVEQIFADKKSFTKKDKDEILSILHSLQAEINSNRDFIYKQFNKQMERTTTEAKGEIEAFMQNKINALASAALVDSRCEVQEELRNLGIQKDI